MRTISLNLLDFELFPEERECRSSYSIRNDASGRLLCEDLQIVYFELPKDRRERRMGRRPRNRLERWLCYLDGMRGDEMDRIAATEPGIGTALDLERERLAYIVNLMEFWDEEDISGRREEEALAKGRAEGRAEGRVEGRVEGRAEGSLETLFSLVRDGLLSVAQASGRLGMTEEEFASRMSQGCTEDR